MNIKKQQEEFLKISQKATRGKLKIYIGSIAGVGKTYRMLQEAHYLQSKRVDIVVGYVETHEREDTEELLSGLKIIPRMKIPYRDVMIEEMDLDTILELKPNVVIVDELAHTNAPSCKNHKRFEDVEDILNNGSNVICAFNIQHLESLNDVISEFTDTKIYETIPDSFFKKADQVVNIDLSAEDILDRLHSGKIYKKNKIEQALQNFFKTENIIKLREVALREVAESVNRKQVKIKGLTTEEKLAITADKLMYCFELQNYSQKQIIRKIARLSSKLKADWYIIYVEDAQTNINNKQQKLLFEDIQFAEEMGAEFIHLNHHNNIHSWINFAKNNGVNHIALNAQTETRTKHVLGISNMQKILKEEPNFDIYLISSNLNHST